MSALTIYRFFKECFNLIFIDNTLDNMCIVYYLISVYYLILQYIISVYNLIFQFTEKFTRNMIQSNHIVYINK